MVSLIGRHATLKKGGPSYNLTTIAFGYPEKGRWWSNKSLPAVTSPIPLSEQKLSRVGWLTS